MTKAPLLLLLAAPAAADPAAMRATIEALSSQAAADPAALSARENASATSGRSFDQSFTIRTLTPVDYVQPGAARREPAELRENVPPPPKDAPKAPEPGSAPAASDGSGADYYFVGTKPLNGITIYTPKKGDGATTGGAAPTEKYGKYGKWGMAGGAALLVAALVAGGGAGIALAALGGLLLGAGAVLSFLFGKKK